MLFEASLVTAAAWIAVRYHRHVPQLTGHPDRAPNYAPPRHDAAADARTERQQYQIVHAAACSHPLLTQSRRVRVVLQDHERAQSAADLVADWNMLQIGQVVRSADDPFLHADESRDAQSDAREPCRAVLFAQLRDRV